MFQKNNNYNNNIIIRDSPAGLEAKMAPRQPFNNLFLGRTSNKKFLFLFYFLFIIIRDNGPNLSSVECLHGS